MMKNLELYVHIPFCIKKCKYCDFLSFPMDEHTQIEYADALIREIVSRGSMMPDYEVSTIYIGGGTPSWLDENKMLHILDTIYKSFTVSSKAEISIECNPGTVTRGKLEKYRKAGINRLSIGLQSADDEELKILGRMHNFQQFLKTYEYARNVGFENVNVDLMSGIPYQTVEKFSKTLQTVIRLKPEHISAYSLIIEKGTPFYDCYKFDLVKQEAGMQTEFLPSEDEVYQILKFTQQCLKESGYKQYEISNFAREGYECKHNIGYWRRENYLGLGLGAASLIENIRFNNTRKLYDYLSNPCENPLDPVELSRKEQMEEFMFLGLRMNEGISRNSFFDSFGVSVEAIYQNSLDYLKKEGLIQALGGNVFLTEKGMDLGNYVMSQFLLD